MPSDEDFDEDAVAPYLDLVKLNGPNCRQAFAEIHGLCAEYVDNWRKHSRAFASSVLIVNMVSSRGQLEKS